jgi:hypothetical protein
MERFMKWKQIDHQPPNYALIFNTGDELAKGLSDFATEQNLADASFKAIGALASARLAWFNPETKNTFSLREVAFGFGRCSNLSNSTPQKYHDSWSRPISIYTVECNETS